MPKTYSGYSQQIKSKVSLNDLILLFADAARTDRQMPGVMRKQKMCSWVDYPDEITSYGYTSAEDTVRLVPEQIQVDRWEIATQLLNELDDKKSNLGESKGSFLGVVRQEDKVIKAMD